MALNHYQSVIIDYVNCKTITDHEYVLSYRRLNSRRKPISPLKPLKEQLFGADWLDTDSFNLNHV